MDWTMQKQSKGKNALENINILEPNFYCKINVLSTDQLATDVLH